ncbi:MAG TPA: zinc-dependent metalloprotease family protein [Phycisphaerales bacterium]
MAGMTGCYRAAAACVLAVFVARPVAAGGEVRSAFMPVDALPASATTIASGQAFAYRAFTLDSGALKERLAKAIPEVDARRGIDTMLVAQQAGATIALPAPLGGEHRFTLIEVPTMEPELAARYPQIKTYAGESLDTPGAQVRLSVTPRGVHALVLSPEGDYLINPADVNPTAATTAYIAFRAADAADGGQFDCTVLPADGPPEVSPAAINSTARRGPIRNDMVLAYLPTAEWANLHGGTVESGLSAMVELTNRLNAIYERELCVRFLLSSQQDQLFQFDPATDGLTNTNATEMLSEAASVFNRLTPGIATNMRHVLGTFGGGVAYLRSACTTQAAVTCSGLPIDNLYTVMVVAHEMGHQFGAEHTFSGLGERCFGNLGTPVEPGGGSTIMSYAQQCYPDNIVNQAELQFHAYAIPGMVSRVTCGTAVPTGNTAPSIVLNYPTTVFVPRLTPLMLTCTATDAEGDPITLTWDAINLGRQTSLASGDTGLNSLFRTFLPTSQTTRVLPRWESILGGVPSPGEITPTFGRGSQPLVFRVFARDNRVGGGGISTVDLRVGISTGVPFALRTHQDGVARSAGPQPVLWDLAGSASAYPNVRISLMRSDLDRDPLVLVASTPNDGNELVDLPDLAIDSARVMVQPIGAPFFDVSRKPFALLPRTAGADVRVAGPARLNDSFANGNNNARADRGESRLRLFVPVVNAGLDAAAGITGTLTSLTPTARVIVAEASWNDLASGGGGENTTPLVVSIDADHPCGEPVSLRLTIGFGAAGTMTHDFAIAVGDSNVSSPPQTFAFTGAAVIPDGDANGVDIPFDVAALPGVVSDVKVRFGGTLVSTDPSSTLVGLNHPYVGDLVITLTDPMARTVTLADRPGGVGNFGKNFNQTLFDMTQIASYFQSAIPRRAPYDGVFIPKDDLNALAGGGVGTWSLRVSDVRAGQEPEAAPTIPQAVRSASLILTCLLPPQCAAPRAYCEGDLNNNGVVDDADFQIFAVAYDLLLNPEGDLDGDTLTTDADFSLFAVAYDRLLCE